MHLCLPVQDDEDENELICYNLCDSHTRVESVVQCSSFYRHCSAWPIMPQLQLQIAHYGPLIHGSHLAVGIEPSASWYWVGQCLTSTLGVLKKLNLASEEKLLRCSLQRNCCQFCFSVILLYYDCVYMTCFRKQNKSLAQLLLYFFEFEEIRCSHLGNALGIQVPPPCKHRDWRMLLRMCYTVVLASALRTKAN